MRCNEFQAHRSCVYSGVLEANRKSLVGMPLKRAGIPWTNTAANAIIASRSCIIIGR